MSDRITRKDVEAAFALAFTSRERASDDGKIEGGGNAHNIGRFFLDHNSAYGGYVIGVYSAGDSSTGTAHGSTPWGTRRRSAREMFDWLNAVRYGRALGELER